MSCEGVMMRMRNRARNGAVGESRLETGAHQVMSVSELRSKRQHRPWRPQQDLNLQPIA